MTVTEPTLFDTADDGAASRADDPETSKTAGHQLDVRVRQAEVLRALRWRAVSSTAEEVRDTLSSRGWRRERNEVASRLAELANPKRFDPPLVRRIGVRKNHRGRDVATWALTSAGAAKAREVDE